MVKDLKERKSNISKEQSEEIRNPFSNSILPRSTNFLTYALILLILFICYFFAATLLGGSLSLMDKGVDLFYDAMKNLDADSYFNLGSETEFNELDENEYEIYEEDNFKEF